MGIFSSKYVTTVGTSISRLVEDEDIEDPVVQAVQVALFQKEDVVDHILESTVNNLAFKAEQSYRYGKHGYVFGLPSGEVYSNALGMREMRQVLEQREGQSVTIDYLHYSPFNSIHAGWIYLIEHYGYNTLTNELTVLSAQKNKPVYLADMVLEIPSIYKYTYNEDSLVVWGRPPNSGYLPTTEWQLSDDLAHLYRAPTPAQFLDIPQERIKVTYLWIEEKRDFRWDAENSYEKITHEESIYIPIPAHNPDANYFHVRYYVGSTPKYWTYEDNSGGYPILDSVYTKGLAMMGDFYPNMYFRLAKTNPKNYADQIWYHSSKKIAKKIGLDFDDLVDQIHENPDIKDVEQAILTLGVPPDSTDKDDLQYLFDFFEQLHLNGGGNAPNDFVKDYLRRFYAGEYANLDESLRSIVIQDGTFKMNLLYRHTTLVRKVGQLGPIGTVTGGSGEYEITRNAVTYTGDNETPTVETVKIPYFVYRKQVGLNWYDEVTVVGLSMRYYVFEEYFTTMADYNDDDVEDKRVLLIPLDRSIIKHYPGGMKNRLVTRNYHFVFNARVVTKVKWYQRGAWRTLIKIAGIVITIASLGSGEFLTAAIAAATTGAYITLITLILEEIINYLIVSTLFRLFVKAVGVDIAFLAAIFAAAYGLYDQLSSGAKKLTATAKNMLSLANGLVGGAQSVLKDMYESLQDDWTGFKKEMEEAWKTLEETRDTLFKDINLVPLVILGESPDDYFRRTVHSGNIGTLLIEDTHTFVDRSLTLPSPYTTLGGLNYGWSQTA